MDLLSLRWDSRSQELWEGIMATVGSQHDQVLNSRYFDSEPSAPAYELTRYCMIIIERLPFEHSIGWITEQI